jgi:hypothetical protein
MIDLDHIAATVAPDGWTAECQWGKFRDDLLFSQNMIPFPDDEADILGIYLRSPDGFACMRKVPAVQEILANDVYLAFLKSDVLDQYREASAESGQR